MLLIRIFVSLMLALGLAACAHHPYLGPPLDPKTGMYPTPVALAPLAVTHWSTRFDPRDYSAILLVTEDPLDRGRLNFLTRKMFVDLGQFDVMTLREFGEWSRDLNFPMGAEGPKPADIVNFSRKLTPVLAVNILNTRVRGNLFSIKLKVQDMRTSQVLLEAEHRQNIDWHEPDEALLFPVLNLLRKWYLAGGEQSV